MIILYPIFLTLFPIIYASFKSDWAAENFPNPRRASDAKACNMRAAASVCDPYSVLTESERYRLNNELMLMAQRTEKVDGDYCDKRGFAPILLVVQEGSQKLVDEINRKWNVDGQCKKALIFLLSSQDHQLYYSTEENTNFDLQQFLAIKAGEEDRLLSGQYTAALVRIFKQIGGAKNIQAATFEREEDYKNRQRGGQAQKQQEIKAHKNSATSQKFLSLSASFLLFFAIFML